MGLGLLGRGLGDVKFLAECGADLTVTDLKTETDLEPTLKKLKKYSNIKYVLGGHRMEDFFGKDFILKNAGVPMDSPYIAEARKNGIPIEMDESLFAKCAPQGVMLIGITGTRGKTTVTTMIYEMLAAAYEKGLIEGKVFLAGNIQGVATLPFLSKVRSGDIVVLELSSWQLQGFGESGISPHISVFTNFLDDHLNYYHGSREKYFTDKSYIYVNQKPEDFLIISKEVLKSAEIFAEKNILAANSEMKGKIIIPKKLPAQLVLRVPGKHNRENAAFVYEVGKLLNLKKDFIEKVLKNFSGVSGRQELVRKIKGIEIYNDTTSTTPDALEVALDSLGKGRNIVLIMGGADKGLDFDPVLPKIKKYCKAIILLSGTGTERLKEDIKKLSNKKISVVEARDLSFALAEAMKNATSGDRIVFSPGFASFGMFKNEYDRGDRFKEILHESH